MSFAAMMVKALCDGSEKRRPNETDRRDLNECVAGSFLVCVCVALLLERSVSSAKVVQRRE